MPEVKRHGPIPEVLKIEIDPREGLRRLVSAPPVKPKLRADKNGHANGKAPHKKR
jgi:hypothetical protein